jgi:hypothetical protein
MPLIIVVLFVQSCSENDSSGNNSGSLDTIKENIQSPKESSMKSGTGKMMANPETAEGMTMINHIITGFWETAEANRNYAMLTEELSYQTDYIIKNCSMKGPDHDSLHSILHPILKEIKNAKNAESYEEADASLKTIQALTQEFSQKFEVEKEPV